MPEIKYSDNPNEETAFVETDDGQRTRAVLTAAVDGEIEFPANPNSTKVSVTVDGVKRKAIAVATIAGGGDQHNLGYYATQTALEEAHATAEAGDWAIVGATDTVWIWDEDTSAWVDSDQKGQVTSVNGQTGEVSLSIPDAVQYSTMPTASADNLGDIVQFTGTTDANYTNGYFYKCGVASTTPASATIAQTTGSTLSDLTVNGETFWEELEEYDIPQQTGDYAFTYNGGTGYWDYGDDYFDLSDFGVTYTGTPADGDVLTISVTAPSATYAWTRVDVQPAPSGLPDQTGQSGKFLTTDGTDASWSDKPLVNSAVNSGSLNIGGDESSIVSPGSNNTLVGKNNSMTNFCAYTTAVGDGVYATTGGVFIGRNAFAASSAALYGIAIGQQAGVNAQRAIQLGAGQTNSDANTFKVANANGNFEIMSADGTIPEARLADTTNAAQGQVLTLDGNLNAVWAAGGGGSSYTAGVGIDITNNEIGLADTSGMLTQDEPYMLTATEDSGTGEVTTSWSDEYVKSINGDYGDVQLFPEDLLSVPQYPYLANDEAFDPQAPRNHGLVVQYSGATDQDYTQGYFYKSVIDTSVPESATLGTVQEVGISNVALNASTFITAMGGNDYDQSYTFNWNDTDGEWYFEWSGENVGSDLTGYGITYDGTPTEGDSITVEYTAQGYMWEQIDVQPSSGGATYTAGNGISIDANNEISVTDPVLVNNATGSDSLSVLGGATAATRAIAIGKDAAVTENYGIAIGSYLTQSAGGIAIGSAAQTNGAGIAIGDNNPRALAGGGNGAIAIGAKQRATAAGAIQIGTNQASAYTNTDANTFKVSNANGNFEIMSADGTVPTDRFTTTPVADGTYVPTLTIASGVATRTWSAPASGTLSISVTLPAASWVNDEQTVTATGVTASNTVIVGAAPASASEYNTSGVICTAQGTDSLTFSCSTTPSNDLTVTVLIM